MHCCQLWATCKEYAKWRLPTDKAIMDSTKEGPLVVLVSALVEAVDENAVWEAGHLARWEAGDRANYQFLDLAFEGLAEYEGIVLHHGANNPAKEKVLLPELVSDSRDDPETVIPGGIPSVEEKSRPLYALCFAFFRHWVCCSADLPEPAAHVMQRSCVGDSRSSIHVTIS